MTEYRAECNSRPSDSVTARSSSTSIELQMRVCGEYTGEAYLTPEKARTFARGILALADEIDGGEVQKEPATSIKIGDRFRLTRRYLEGADVEVGETVTVVEHVPGGDFRAVSDRTGRKWRFGPENIGDGLERIEAKASDEAPLANPRARYITEAKALLSDTDSSAADVIRLAEFLAAGE